MHAAPTWSACIVACSCTALYLAPSCTPDPTDFAPPPQARRVCRTLQESKRGKQETQSRPAACCTVPSSLPAHLTPQIMHSLPPPPQSPACVSLPDSSEQVQHAGRSTGLASALAQVWSHSCYNHYMHVSFVVDTFVLFCSLP
jgi:hypothetical protein